MLNADAAQVESASTTDVTLIRDVGASLMRRPFTTTVLSLRVGSLNSPTPIRRKVNFPSGATFGMSLAGGAFAILATGSVAATSSQMFAPCSRRHPVTETMSAFFGGGDCAGAEVAHRRISRVAFTATARAMLMGPL